MTDARLPDRWLLNPVMRGLSDTDWRVYTWALMQANNQETDGFIPASALALLHPEGKQPESYERLCAAGLWSSVTGGYQSSEWGETQSTAEALQRSRDGSAKRSRDSRARKREEELELRNAATKDSAETVTHVTRDVTRDVTRAVLGQDRLGKARIGKALPTMKVERNNDDDEPWPVAAIPGQGTELTNKCFVCGSALSVSLPRERALCDKKDTAHNYEFTLISKRHGAQQTARVTA